MTEQRKERFEDKVRNYSVTPWRGQCSHPKPGTPSGTLFFCTQELQHEGPHEWDAGSLERHCKEMQAQVTPPKKKGGSLEPMFDGGSIAFFAAILLIATVMLIHQGSSAIFVICGVGGLAAFAYHIATYGTPKQWP